MKLKAKVAMTEGTPGSKNRMSPGDEFEASEERGARLIELGMAEAVTASMAEPPEDKAIRSPRGRGR